jgi:hypothetical protein
MEISVTAPLLLMNRLPGNPSDAPLGSPLGRNESELGLSMAAVPASASVSGTRNAPM